MSKRERWGSKLGVILAVAGSAIGLGNFLRFPVQAASNGGGAFMVPYFISILLLGLPLMWIEWTIGRFGGGFEHSTAPGIFHSIWNKNRFIKYFGVIGIFGPIVILIYYTYIESWLLGYSFFALTGKYDACTSPEQMKAFLEAYQGIGGDNGYFTSITPAYIFFIITFAVNISVVYFGINKGIEKVCKFGLPLLFAMAIILVVKVLSLGTPDPAKPENNIINGLGFLWNPKWEMLLDAKVWLAAAGQVFFTLSCGIGVILTYSSYLTKKDDVALSGLTAAATNEFAEVVLGGSLIIPAAFAFFGASGVAQVAKGGAYDLGFVTMPLILENFAGSHFFGFLWFFLLFIAGVTSSISLAQPAVAFAEDEFNISRPKACIGLGVAVFVLCQPVIFFMSKGVLNELDFWGGTFCLVIFATVESILFAWVFGMDKAWEQMHIGSDIRIPKFYRFIIKYITPTLLIIILGVWFWQDWINVIVMAKVEQANKPYVIGTRILLVVLFLVLALFVKIAWRRRKDNPQGGENAY